VQTGRAQIETRLRDLLAGRAAFGDALSVDAHASLLDHGLDSTAVMSLVVGIEESFGIDIPDAAITESNFGSVAAICRYIEIASTQ
jgi:acyl carrier protein